ncbi:MAG TPA: hypothetical protein VJM74_05775 [Nitrososphaeraceae archaeon]|nr:hypothetical protein [Nitrososphaeraceae archaeon]
MTKFEVMFLKLGDYITKVFTYLYDDVTENSFSQTASTHTIRDLRTNDISKQIDIISIIQLSR